MDHPKLRPIEAFPVDFGGREVICLRDPTQQTDDAVFVPREALFLLAHECVARQINPVEMVHIADFIQAIREVASARAEPVCYIVGGDLAHVGMKFGDQGGLTPTLLDQVARDDYALLAAAARMDAEGFFRLIAEHHDRRRICGFPPTYMLLSTMPATAGTVLKYDQAVEPATQSMVSYASVVFH